MSFKDLTPEQRAAAGKKGAATRARNKAAVKEPPRAASPNPFAPSEPEPVGPEETPAPASEPDYNDILSPAEIEAIRLEAKRQVLAERKAAQKKAALAAALDEERHAIGSMPEDEERKRWLEELVDVPVHLPRLRTIGNVDNPPDPIIIDQRIFADGRTVTVSRAVAMTLHEIIGKRWMHQEQVDGRPRAYYNHELGSVVYMGGVARGGGMQGGPTFSGIHKRPA